MMGHKKYSKARLWIIGLAGLGFLTGVLEARSDSAGNPSELVAMPPGDLQWTTASSLPKGAAIAVVHGNPKGAEPLTIRLKFPANYQVPPHSHPVTENVTVLSGALHVGLGETLEKSKAQKLAKDGFIRVPASVPHYAWTTEETIIQLHSDRGPWGISYVNPEDDPRRKAS